MSVKITDRTRDIKATFHQKASVFLRIATDVLTDTSTPKTPMSSGTDSRGAKKGSGNLRRDVLKQVLGLKAQVRWRKEYAAYQERGMRRDGSHKVRRYTTAGTGAHFARNAVIQLKGMTGIISKRSGLT